MATCCLVVEGPRTYAILRQDLMDHLTQVKDMVCVFLAMTGGFLEKDKVSIREIVQLVSDECSRPIH